MKNIKKSLELNIIPLIMIIISIFIDFTTEENMRKILIIIGAVLFGVHIQKCITMIKEIRNEDRIFK